MHFFSSSCWNQGLSPVPVLALLRLIIPPKLVLQLAFLCCGWKQSWDEEEIAASSTGAASCPTLPFACPRARVKSWQAGQWGRLGATFLFRSAGFSWTWAISCFSCCYLFHYAQNWSCKCGTAEEVVRQKPMSYISTYRQHLSCDLRPCRQGAWQEGVMEQREVWREGGLKWHKEMWEGRPALGVQEGSWGEMIKEEIWFK